MSNALCSVRLPCAYSHTYARYTVLAASPCGSRIHTKASHAKGPHNPRSGPDQSQVPRNIFSMNNSVEKEREREILRRGSGFARGDLFPPPFFVSFRHVLRIVSETNNVIRNGKIKRWKPSLHGDYYCRVSAAFDRRM